MPADLKVYRANGNERICRADTTASVRFGGHGGRHSGLTADTLIVQQADYWTARQEAMTAPCLHSSANSQLIRTIAG